MSVNSKTIKETGLIGNLFKSSLSYQFWYVYDYRTCNNDLIDIVII